MPVQIRRRNQMFANARYESRRPVMLKIQVLQNFMTCWPSFRVIELKIKTNVGNYVFTNRHDVPSQETLIFTSYQRYHKIDPRTRWYQHTSPRGLYLEKMNASICSRRPCRVTLLQQGRGDINSPVSVLGRDLSPSPPPIIFIGRSMYLDKKILILKTAEKCEEISAGY